MQKSKKKKIQKILSCFNRQMQKSIVKIYSLIDYDCEINQNDFYAEFQSDRIYIEARLYEGNRMSIRLSTLPFRLSN